MPETIEKPGFAAFLLFFRNSSQITEQTEGPRSATPPLFFLIALYHAALQYATERFCDNVVLKSSQSELSERQGKMIILEEFWYGNIHPTDREIVPNSRMDRCSSWS